MGVVTLVKAGAHSCGWKISCRPAVTTVGRPFRLLVVHAHAEHSSKGYDTRRSLTFSRVGDENKSG